MAKRKKKMKAKNFKKGRETEPLLKSDEAMTREHKPIDMEIYNRADSALHNLTHNTGIPRQKVRMK